MSFARSVCWLLGAIIFSSVLNPAIRTHAQEPAQNANPATQNFAIVSGTLSAALMSFGRQAGLQVSYLPQVTDGKTSRGVSGTMPPRQALTRVLAGTGLAYRFTNMTTVTVYDPKPVVAVTAPGDLALPTIEVQGENAWGPVKGYVATRSATGTKTDSPLIETPQSISVVTRDQIDAQQAFGVKEALRYTAGVAADNRAGFTSTDIAYGRGFILNRFADGMRLQGDSGYMAPQPEIYGAERVEVLRGPASVLYGQSSPGGIINVVTKRPTAQAFGEAQLQAGSNNRFQTAFDIGGPADKNGEFLYRLTGLLREADNQVDYVKEERQYIAPAFTWRPNTDTTWTLLAHYQRDPHAGLYNFVPYKGSVVANANGSIPTSFYAGDPSYNNLNRTQASLTSLFEHRFDSVWTVRQNTRYMSSNGDMNQILPLLLLANDRTLMRYGQTTHDDIAALSLDNQAQADFTTGPVQHKVLVGLDYQNTIFTERFTQGLATSLDIFNPSYGAVTVAAPIVNSYTQQRQSQIGLYAQDQIKIDRLALLFSGRQDEAKSYTTNILNGSTTGQDDSAFTKRVGAVYLFDIGLAPYAAYATSFNPQTGSAFDGTPFKPTTGRLYEGGIKYQPKDTNSFIQVSVFDLTQQNVLTTDAAHTGFSVQTGEVRSRGIEFEAKLSLSDRLDVIASYAYIDPKVTASNSTDLGKIPVNIPRQVASAWADYTIRDGSLAGLGFGFGVRYTGETYADAVNTIPVPSYTVADAAIHYDLGSLSKALKGTKLSINATNLFDKVYASQCTYANVFGPNTNCVYGLRRQVLATLSYRW